MPPNDQEPAYRLVDPSTGDIVGTFYENGNGDVEIQPSDGTQYKFAQSPANKVDVARLQNTTDVKYKADANSPFTATQTDSITCTLADRYDEWLILIELGLCRVFDMQLNGNTGNNYLYTDSTDGVTSDRDRIVVAQDEPVSNDPNVTRASYIVDGNWSGDGTCSLTAYNGSGAKQVETNRDPTMYDEGDVSPP